MKPSPSKSVKTAGKKRGRDEAVAAAAEAAPPMSPPRPDPSHEWKKSKTKTEDLLALLNSGFIREKEMDMWRAATGGPYPMEKSEEEIPMFARFAEHELALPASDFFKGLLGYYGVEYLNLNPNGIFHIAVFVHFCEAFLGIKPHWILFRKFFRVKHSRAPATREWSVEQASRCGRTAPSSTSRTSSSTPTKTERRNGSTSRTTTQDCRSRVGSSRSIAPGGTRSP
jgi:hypothetical protein